MKTLTFCILSSLLLAGCGGSEPTAPSEKGGDLPISVDSIPLPRPMSEPDAADTLRIIPPPISAESAPSSDGTVVVTTFGPFPAVLLLSPGRTPVQLVGPLADELQRLDGGLVAVRGDSIPGAMGPALRATSYEILEIDGLRPWVGALVPGTGADQWELETGSETLHLEGLGTDTRLVHDAWIWVTGSRSGGSISVATYGILRPGA